jgi:hypothetical protein
MEDFKQVARCDFLLIYLLIQINGSDIALPLLSDIRTSIYVTLLYIYYRDTITIFLFNNI